MARSPKDTRYPAAALVAGLVVAGGAAGALQLLGAPPPVIAVLAVALGLFVASSLKFTTGFGYTEIGFGTSGDSNSGEGYLGLGAHIPLGRLSFDLGGRISSTTRDDPNTGGPERTDVHYLGRVNVSIVRGIELFGGGGARHGVLGKGAGHAEPEFLGGVAFF